MERKISVRSKVPTCCQMHAFVHNYMCHDYLYVCKCTWYCKIQMFKKIFSSLVETCTKLVVDLTWAKVFSGIQNYVHLQDVPRQKVPASKRPKYKTSQDIRCPVPASKHPNYRTSQLHNDQSLKTSKIQNIPDTKRPKPQNFPNAKCPSYKMSQASNVPNKYAK